MGDPIKTIQNAFKGTCTKDNLFESAQALLEIDDPQSNRDFLEIGHLPKVNTIISRLGTLLHIVAMI